MARTDAYLIRCPSCGTKSVPTFLIFDKGQLRETIPGAVNKGMLQAKMRPCLYAA